ncbi:hypothetical protein glysoja_012599 [Glycine soja]|nr:hypothetical protein glysoja_012599 [Glycine soja]
MEVILEILGGNSFFIDVGPWFFIEVGPLDTVLDVKEKVQNLHNIPISYQTFLFNGEILQDDLQVSTSGIDRGSRIGLLVAPPDDANLAPPQPTLTPPWHTRPFGMPEFPPNEIDVYLKPPQRPPRPVVLKVTVLPLNSKEKIEMEVKAEDKVAVLREKLELVHRTVRFRLPTRGRYFFVHKLSLMDESISFRCHNVRNGDSIGTYWATDHNDVAKEDDDNDVDTIG